MQLVVATRLLLDAAPIEVAGFTLWVRAQPPGRRCDEEVVRSILEGDEYQLAPLCAAGDRPRTVLDVGAHVGAFTLKVKRLWPEARVIAAEPDPESAALLAHNVGGLDGVSVFAGAVLGRPGARTTRLRQGGANADGNAAASRVEEVGAALAHGEGAAATVVVDALDVIELLDRHGNPEIDLLKLDCEGAEGEILARLAAAGRLHRVGWIRGEWHFPFNPPRIADALAATHVVHLDPGGPHPWGSFIAHRKAGIGAKRPPLAPLRQGRRGRHARPRVCVVFPHRELGGGETAMIAVAEALRRRAAVSVCVLDQVPGGAPLPARRDPNDPNADARPQPLFDLAPELVARFGTATVAATGQDLVAALEDQDVALWYGLNPAVPRALASMTRRPRSLRVVHTEKEQEVDVHRRWRHVIDDCACVSPVMRDRIDDAVVIPNPCSRDRLRGSGQRLFAGGAARTARSRHPPILGFLGRLLLFKRAAWLVERLAELDCNLVVQGIDTAEQTRAGLAALAAAHGTTQRLHLLPPGMAIGTLLRSVDAVVVLSASEGFPMVVVEAGMLGVPVIATRVGALPQVFADEILFVDSRDGEPDVASLRQALARLGPGVGAPLRRKVARLCSQEAVAGLYLDRIHALLGRGL